MPLPAAHYWFPWMPDFAAGVQDSPTDLASMADAISGAEERAVWLPRARRSLAFRLAPREVATGVRMADNLRAALVTGRASLPHWGRGRVVSAYAPGSAVLTTALPHGLVVGSMAALYRPGDDSARLVEVYSVASAVQLTLTNPIPAGWVGVVWVAPVLHGRVGNPSWSALSDLRSISVEFSELPPLPVPVPNWEEFEFDASHIWGPSGCIGALTGASIVVRYSNSEGPCPGGHQCDAAIFKVRLNGVLIGVVDLNNGSDGGDRSPPPLVVTSSQAADIAAADGEGLALTFECFLGEGACHEGLGWVRVFKPGGSLVYEGCPTSVASEIDLCGESPAP